MLASSRICIRSRSRSEWLALLGCTARSRHAPLTKQKSFALLPRLPPPLLTNPGGTQRHAVAAAHLCASAPCC